MRKTYSSESITFRLVLQNIIELAPGVRQFFFDPLDFDELDFQPGQFIQLSFNNHGERFRRSYSIATRCGETTAIEIVVSSVLDGRVSGVLFGTKVGDVVEASGPYGNHILINEPPARLFMVATGTGVIPYRSMLPELLRRANLGWPTIKVILGVRSRTQAIFADEFSAAATRSESFQFTCCYSDDEPINLQSWERGGMYRVFWRMRIWIPSPISFICAGIPVWWMT
ncbi:ferredoxin--NADP reductase [Pseudohongiella sp.]|uniref:FAD-binding FR-type domain-containing protein n=1 Tax=marine sediment metagenome TaxID=412755 RepID=A0A0F9YHY6_9ZZZZ|nr:FAD-dependent oxidoreductase [Pseudohongiella sp.]HDZ08450.1 FAD-dependent oxidoreductase [Pseudohongiella sp.]